MSVEKRQSKWVVIPNRPDWTTNPTERVEWDVIVGLARSGAEKRTAMRTNPKITLEFEVDPTDLTESVKLRARLDAAISTGYAAVPRWGSGMALGFAAAATDTEITLAEATDYPWFEGEYVFLCSMDPDGHAVWEVNVIVDPFNDQTFTLLNPLANDYAAGWHVYPMLLGRLKADGWSARSDWHPTGRLSIESTEPADGSAEIIPPEGPALTAEDDLASYANHGFSEATLDGGTGWDGPWGAIFDTFDALMIEDDLSDYSNQAFDDGDMDGGTGFDGAWRAVWHTVGDDYDAIFWFRSDLLSGIDGEEYRFLPNCARAGEPAWLHSNASGTYDEGVIEAGVLNGLPVISISGSDYVNLFAEIPADFQIFAVFADFRADEGGDSVTNAILALNAPYTISNATLNNPPYTTIFGTHDSDFACQFGTGTALDTAAKNTPATRLKQTGGTAPNSFAVAECVVKDGFCYPRINDTVQTARTTHDLAATGLRIGSLGWGPTGVWPYPENATVLRGWVVGKMAELIITSDTTEATRAAIRQDILARWGI